MGLRFRKSVNIGPLRINASKTGLGYSVGVPGARYTKMANGRKRVTASLPGTGISWVEESKKTQTDDAESFFATLLAILVLGGVLFVTIFIFLTARG